MPSLFAVLDTDVTVGNILTFIGMLVSVIWAISRIKSLTEKLGIRIDHLNSTIERHTNQFDSLCERHNRHEVRISILEEKNRSMSSTAD